jgi:hypothetical protein
VGGGDVLVGAVGGVGVVFVTWLLVWGGAKVVGVGAVVVVPDVVVGTTDSVDPGGSDVGESWVTGVGDVVLRALELWELDVAGAVDRGSVRSARSSGVNVVGGGNPRTGGLNFVAVRTLRFVSPTIAKTATRTPTVVRIRAIVCTVLARYLTACLTSTRRPMDGFRSRCDTVPTGSPWFADDPALW